MRPRHAAQVDGGDALPTDELPPWLAFERRIMVQREAPALRRRALARPGTLGALRAPAPGCVIARLRANGIEVGVNAMPVLPGITDAPATIDELVQSVKSADASYINGDGIDRTARHSTLSNSCTAGTWTYVSRWRDRRVGRQRVRGQVIPSHACRY